ncbi:Hsp20/alpha crystallin family protein [Aquimarina brevivitae]|uniref:HSP20 family protein n=1 Tax=Aquimarina brevivitae TaxID=323412 RepID=A0A4Q7P375_9FLAO|nr:Hsp20/alpha crystallin family protein [Aquimarina brevivitae]RZS93850.1 HSP20 family protein [Aquimarina brevivitae]
MSLLRRTAGLYPSFMENFFDDEWYGQKNMIDTGTKVPAINIRELDDNFEIQVAAPGMNEDDFDISIENSTLTIAVEKRTSSETKEEDKYTRREFNYTSFSRSFTLPDTVLEDEITAEYDQGVLTLAIPKKEEAKPKPPKNIKVTKKRQLAGKEFSTN